MNENRNRILKRLTNEVLTGDGAIGTMLYTKGVSLDNWLRNWLASMSMPGPR